MAAESPVRDRAGTVLSLTGPANLEEVPRLRDAILAAQAEGAPLLLDLEGSGPWDLAGLQLIVAAIRDARREGRPATLSRVPGPLRDLAESMGLRAWLAASTDGSGS